MFETPIIIAGKFGAWGCVEGTGTSARFDQPWSGTFVKNYDYVKTRARTVNCTTSTSVRMRTTAYGNSPRTVSPQLLPDEATRTPTEK